MARAGLDKNSVIRRAAKLANEEGLENVTLKRLADDLGIQPPSLYNHISGMEDLQKQLMIYGWKQMQEKIIRAVIGVSGYDALRAAGHAFYDYATENAGVFRAMLWYNKFQDEETMEATKGLFTIIYKITKPLNISEDNIEHLVRTWRGFLEGFSLLVNNGAFGHPLSIKDSFEISLNVLVEGSRSLEEKKLDYRFKNFDNHDYEKVRNFLIELSGEDRLHINWNWARWEWMFFHPESEKSLLEKIGLWFCGEELIGFATYDMCPGECFFAVKRGFEELENDILEYAVKNFSNEKGLGIAANDRDDRTIDLLKSHGFVRDDQAENVLELDLNEAVFTTDLIEGFTFGNIDPERDVYKHQKVLWKGFDHEGEAPSDEDIVDKQRILLTAPHLNPLLHVVAKDQHSEYVSYCGLWYDEATDYAYVEPVCTIPEYRKKGVGRATVMEALKRARDLGAKRAYVISYTDFYDKLGFKPHSHYTFYRYHV